MSHDRVSEPAPVLPVCCSGHQRRYLILLSVILLLSGVVIGACGMMLYFQARGPFPPRGGPGGPGGPARFMMTRLLQDIPLPSDREEKVRELIEQHFSQTHAKLDAILNPMMQEMVANIQKQIPAEYHDRLQGNFEEFLRRMPFRAPNGGPEMREPGGQRPPAHE